MSSSLSMALFLVLIPVIAIVCIVLFIILRSAKEKTATAIHGKSLVNQLKQLAAEHNLTFSEQLFFPDQRLSLSIDPTSRRFILSTKDLAPTVFHLDDVTGVNVRNATDSYLKLLNQWFEATNAHAPEAALFESVLNGTRGNVASIALTVAGQEIIMPFIVNNGRMIFDETARKNEAIMMQFADTLQKYLQ